MMRRPAMVTAAAVLCAAFVTSAGAAADAGTPANAAVGRTWGTAAEVPGTAALNKSGQAGVGALSCAASGDCSAGGSYASGPGVGGPTLQAYVVNETHGTWGTAKEVPGTAALNAGGNAKVLAISCATAGNCLAGGYYTQGASGLRQAFVVTETGGTWATAVEVSGTATLNQGHPGAAVTSVSCAAPGDCSAGGLYLDAAFNEGAFIVNETNGTWGAAEEVPGIAALNQGSPGATVASVSCAGPLICSAGGFYSDSGNNHQAFVVNERNGIWRTAEEVPGTASLNAGGLAGIGVLSCPTSGLGLCSAGGSYTDASLHTQAFTVNESSG